jgi:hypothetical protein
MSQNYIKMATSKKNKTPGPVHLELTLQEVNTVLESLSKQPFIEVYKLIEKIHLQAKESSSREN